MGHEYLHAQFNHIGYGSLDGEHASIYKWQSEQAAIWKYSSTRLYQQRYNLLSSQFNSRFDVSRFGFDIIKNKPIVPVVKPANMMPLKY